MLTFLLSLTAIVSVGGDSWHPVDQVWDGVPMCAVAQQYADGSLISVVVTDKGFANNVFKLMVTNPAWSIKTGDQLGDVRVSTPNGEFTGNADARDNTFAVTGRLESLEAFLSAAQIDGFKLYLVNKHRELGKYAPAGLDASLPSLQSCIARRFDPKRDPFRK